jgi:hypothetical protein
LLFIHQRCLSLLYSCQSFIGDYQPHPKSNICRTATATNTSLGLLSSLPTNACQFRNTPQLHFCFQTDSSPSKRHQSFQSLNYTSIITSEHIQHVLRYVPDRLVPKGLFFFLDKWYHIVGYRMRHMKDLVQIPVGVRRMGWQPCLVQKTHTMGTWITCHLRACCMIVDLMNVLVTDSRV